MASASSSLPSGSRREVSPAGLIARGLPGRRIVVLGHDSCVEWLVDAAAREIRAEIRLLQRVEDLAAWLRTSTVDLVVACGAATARSEALLAMVRGQSRPTSCLVISFVHPCLAEVVVGDATGRPISRKVVDREVLARLPARLVAGEDPWGRVD
jgi:hypothetical protein